MLGYTGYGLGTDASTPAPHTAGGRYLIISLKNNGDERHVANKNIPVRGPVTKTKHRQRYEGEAYNVSVWYCASSAIPSGVYVTFAFSVTEDFDHTEFSSSVALLSNAAATTVWQQVLLNIKVPTLNNPVGAGANLGPFWARLIVGGINNTDAPIELYFDDSDIIATSAPNADNVAEDVTCNPNPSFDFPGQDTSNPASIIRQILQSGPTKPGIPALGRNVSAPLLDNRIDIPAFEDWSLYCDENGTLVPRGPGTGMLTGCLAFNGILDKASNIQDAMKAVATPGRASIQSTYGVYAPIIDRAGKTPKQHFTPRTINKYSWQVAFTDRPHALRARFANRDNDYQPDEVLAYDDGYSAGGYVPGPIPVNNLLIAVGVGAVTTFPLNVGPIVPGSLVITAGGITGTESGGTISGTGISGTIDETTGVGSVTFAVAPGTQGRSGVQVKVDVLASFSNVYNINNEFIGTGDGSTTTFPLLIKGSKTPSR